MIIDNGILRAEVVVECGANLFSLIHKETGCEIMRRPGSMEELRESPCVYGTPVLFPPNRIGKGRFQACGREYVFPVNDNDGRDNHLHGFLYKRPWRVDECADARMLLRFTNGSDSGFFELFPHEFEFRLEYELDGDSLIQRVAVKNCSKSPMPFGLGFHTAFAVDPDDRCRIALDERRWLIDDRSKLADGTEIELGEFECFRGKWTASESLAMSGHMPVGEAFDRGDGVMLRGAALERRGYGLRVYYETGKEYPHWVLWNKFGGNGFVCIEPQSWVVDAPNLSIPPECSGFRCLAPGEEWKGRTELTIKTSGEV